ncbi:FxsA family protein [Falsibacillus pallidus]|uniref:FxsA family protein n=1 Tax=Falsibacillus pallidus TaxID=493781 RepID=UPI003D95EFD6
MKYLFLFLIIVPALEIWLFILAGSHFGVWSTIGLIILTGILGAYFAKQQGISAIHRVQESLKAGRAPGDAIIDGVCILAGAIFLITPGFITDTIGFLLLIPASRGFIKPFILKLIRKWIDNKNVIIYR